MPAQSPGYLHYDLGDGLPSNLVYCAVQDQEGYMWFGTDRGLSRFDGERFKNYGVADGLPDKEVLNLYADRHKRLWICCFERKMACRKQGRIYNAETDTMIRKIEFETPITGFYEDKQQDLWISGADFYRVRGDELKRYKAPPGSYGPSNMHNIGTTFLGLNLWVIYEIKPEPQLEYKTLLQFNEDEPNAHSFTVSGNRLVYAFPHKTVLLEYVSGTVRILNTIRTSFESVFTDSQGRFWGCSTGKGAICFDNPNRDLGNPRSYLQGHKVLRTYEDRQGNFWFMTSAEGIFKLPKHHAVSWTREEGLASENILSLAVLPDGDVMASDDAGFVHRFRKDKKPQTISINPYGRNNFIRGIAALDSTRIGIACDEGFFLIPTKSTPQRAAKLSNAKLGTGKSILYTKQKLWLGSSFSLGCYDTAAESFDHIFRDRSSTLGQDAESNVWRGNGEGLYCETDQFQKNWGDIYPEFKKRIAAIRSDPDGNLWVLNQEERLFKLSIQGGNILQSQWMNQGFRHQVRDIKDFYVSHDKSIWLATTRGIYSISPSGDIIHFSRQQGLASDDVNAVLIHEGAIWAATTKGLTRLYLKDLLPTSNDFKTSIVEFRYQLKDSLVRLDYSGSGDKAFSISFANGSNLEADFAALDRKQDGKFQFEHIMQKSLLPFFHLTFPNLLTWIASVFDSRINTDTQILNNATLNLGISLPAGKYQFLTSALSSSGSRSNQAVRWELLVMPNWYEIIWIWIFVFAVIGFWLYRTYRLRIRYIGMEASASQWQLQALRSQINPHFVGNSINSIQQFFYPPDPVKASEYIHLFTGLLRKTLSLSERDFIPLEEEIAFDKSYLDMVQLRYGNQFSYEITGTENMAMQTRFPAMILQPILENATIHGLAPSGVSLLRIHFRQEGKRIICTITDNGIGMRQSKAIKRSKLTGHQSKGTEILDNKIQMLNRVYHIQLTMEATEQSDMLTKTCSGTRITISYTLASSNSDE